MWVGFFLCEGMKLSYVQHSVGSSGITWELKSKLFDFCKFNSHGLGSRRIFPVLKAIYDFILSFIFVVYFYI